MVMSPSEKGLVHSASLRDSIPIPRRLTAFRKIFCLKVELEQTLMAFSPLALDDNASRCCISLTFQAHWTCLWTHTTCLMFTQAITVNFSLSGISIFFLSNVSVHCTLMNNLCDMHSVRAFFSIEWPTSTPDPAATAQDRSLRPSLCRAQTCQHGVASVELPKCDALYYCVCYNNATISCYLKVRFRVSGSLHFPDYIYQQWHVLY